LPLAARRQLCDAEPDNPYYRIARGNPGTHDVGLGVRTVTALKAADDAARTPIPVFDKSSHAGQGDRVDAARWPVCIGRPDFVLLEGWCVGAPSLPDAEYRRLKNAAPEALAWEQRHDPTGRFGAAINARLRDYAPLFACLAALIYLKVPSQAQVYAWREKQEAALRARTGRGMTPAQIREFVDAFLPVTVVHGLGVLGDPSRSPADFIVEVDEQQRPARLLVVR
jgi:D-glycerate 3-kinase